jgi:hypothetical protein
VGPKAGREGAENLTPHRESIPRPSVDSFRKKLFFVPDVVVQASVFHWLFRSTGHSSFFVICLVVSVLSVLLVSL